MRRKKFKRNLKKLEDQMKNLRFQLLMFVAIIIGALMMSVNIMNREKYFIDTDFRASYLMNAKEMVEQDYTPIGFTVKKENQNEKQITTIAEEPENSKIAEVGAGQQLVLVKNENGTSVMYKKYINKSEYMKNIFFRLFIYFTFKLLMIYFLILLSVGSYIEISKYILKKTLEEKKKKLKVVS